VSIKDNYYINTFFWSTLQKVLSALIGFVSVPLLLGYYGKAEYGVLGIATACNGYMHLLDLGMDTGAVRFYSQWRKEGKDNLINKVARTNISFYGIIALINMAGLFALACWGERFFSVTHEQFLLLKTCLIIIALFSIISWGTTTFNQLLISDLQMVFTLQVQCVIALLKAVLISMVFYLQLSLEHYFLFLTGIVALLIFPYAYKCKKLGLIDKLRPAFYWKEFNVVIMFSLSIFTLSLFQATATQTRPIILSIFANDGAGAVAEFRIIEVIPQLIIMIGGTFSGIFLPKTSSMVVDGNQREIEKFAYRWTVFTTIIINVLTIPFIICSQEILSAYVGRQYDYLSIWLCIWCFTVLIQMHTTPGNALVLAYGKTRLLVITTSVACLSSMVLNAYLAPLYGVGAAVISYFLYVLVVIGLYYIGYYKKLLSLSRRKMFLSFLKPTLLSFIVMMCVLYIPIDVTDFDFSNVRSAYVTIFVIKSLLWLIPYAALLIIFRVLNINEFRISYIK